MGSLSNVNSDGELLFFTLFEMCKPAVCYFSITGIETVMENLISLSTQSQLGVFKVTFNYSVFSRCGRKELANQIFQGHQPNTHDVLFLHANIPFSNTILNKNKE